MKKLHVVLILVLISLISSTLISAQSEIQNLDVVDADIRDVFRSLGELGGYNILLDRKVQGNITFKVTNPLPTKQIIELLAQTYGYAFQWIKKDSTVIIGDKETFKGFDNRITKVYRLNYASVDQVAKALEVIVPAEQIGKDPRANQLTIRGNSLEHENISELLKSLDREVPQVNIEARIEELTDSAKQQMGFKQGTALEPGVGFTGGYNNTQGWFLDPAIDLEFLETQNKARMIANPNISTTDNQEGKILIGDKIPVITSTETSSGKTYSVNYIEVGTKLKIVPRINSDNIVTVTIQAEVSSVTEWRELPTGDYVPVIKTREVNSVIRLKDGQTFVLSGLIKKDSKEVTTGTPFLSKIPVLGWLFKDKVTGPNENMEICIFITPHIVKFDKDGAPTNTGVEIKTKDSNESELEKATTDKTDNATPAATNGQTADAKVETVTSTETQETPAQTATADTEVTPVVIEDTSVKPEDAPAPPPEPIQVVIDDKTSSTTTPLTTDTVNTTRTATTDATLPKEIQYTVKKEDNLYQISRKFGVTQDTIISRNQLASKDTIKVGQTIFIPVPPNHLYQIKPKETLWRIAKRYGTTVDVLMEINGLTDASQIKSGQTIILPTAVDKVANADY